MCGGMWMRIFAVGDESNHDEKVVKYWAHRFGLFVTG
jgi:hypothetical protein